MAKHERFHFKAAEELRTRCAELEITLPWSDDLSVLSSPARFGEVEVANRLVVLPMEGCDSEADGSPGPLTFRRYERFAAGGAGLIWVEACAVVREGRANPHQLWLTKDNLPAYRELVQRVAAAAPEGRRPALILQLTHAGRYAKTKKYPDPYLMQHSPLDRIEPPGRGRATAFGIPYRDSPTFGGAPPKMPPPVNDVYLERLIPAFAAAATLAQEAGFDAVDVKACHGYLFNEALGARTREGSAYGGSYDHRARLLLDTVRLVRDSTPGLGVTVRLNLYDALEYPFGWGVAQDDARPDLTEPLRLIGQLVALGIGGLGVSVGNPHVIPYVNRPYNTPLAGVAMPPEHPLEGVDRILRLTAEVQRAYLSLPVVGFGYSWLRHFFPQVAAGVLREGGATFAGLGRGALAYPDYARAILRDGAMQPARCCVACSHCSQMMRDGTVSGCPVHDRTVYGPIYRAGREQTWKS